LNNYPTENQPQVDYQFEQPTAKNKNTKNIKLLAIVLIVVLVAGIIANVIVIAGRNNNPLAKVTMSEERVIYGKEDGDLFNSEGLIKVQKDGYYGFINKDGEMVIRADFEKIGKFTNGVAVVSEETADGDDKYAVIDTSGEFVVPYRTYDYISSFNCGLALVSDEDDKCGYINTSGDLEIEMEFYYADTFSDDGYAKALTAEKEWVLIDTSGDVVCTLEVLENESICLEDGCYELSGDEKYCYDHN